MAALPYIQLYVADYLADTAHLNAAQHGAYLLLLMNYWQRGKPLNNANERLANVARMSNEEWLSVKDDIAEFFEIDGDEWRHARIERDLAAVAEKSDKAKAAGKASASKRYKQSSNERSTSVEQVFNHTDTDTDTEKKDKPNGLSKKPRAKTSKTPLPEDFAVSDRVKAWAAEKGYLCLDQHLDAFKRKCLANGYTYADWDAAFMEAIRGDWAKINEKLQAKPRKPWEPKPLTEEQNARRKAMFAKCWNAPQAA